MLRYLDDAVQESDFERMASWGATVVRVPMGYWNWIDMSSYSSVAGDEPAPDAPPEVQARFRNLQKIKPAAYRPYIDKIAAYAAKYGLQIYPELHGAPGS